MPGFDYSQRPSGLSVLYDSGYTVGTPAALDTGATIPPGHLDLMVFLYLRTNRAAPADNINIIFNNDSAAHYDFQRLQGITTTASASSGSANIALGSYTVESSTAAAGSFSAIQLLIPSYDNTVGWKAVLTMCVAPDPSQFAGQMIHGQWHSTAAINRITVNPVVGTAFAAGSRMVVYGLQ